MKIFCQLFLLIFLLLTFSREAAAQCCSAGNPISGDGILYDFQKNQLKIQLNFDHSLSTDYYHLSQPVVVPALDKSYYDFTSLSFNYGLSNRLSLLTEFGYFFDKTQKLQLNQEDITIQSHGFGDIALSLRVLVFKSIFPATQWTISGGIKLPLGAFEEKMNGITIPIALQPSSGAFKYNLGTHYSIRLSGRKLGFFAFALYEYSSTIQKDFLVHKYGDYFQLSLGANYPLGKEIILSGKIKNEFRGQDRREYEIIIGSTGSTLIQFCPMVIYSLNKKWQIIANLDIPIYKRVKGYQLTKYGSLQIGINYNLHSTEV